MVYYLLTSLTGAAKEFRQFIVSLISLINADGTRYLQLKKKKQRKMCCSGQQMLALPNKTSVSTKMTHKFDV